MELFEVKNCDFKLKQEDESLISQFAISKNLELDGGRGGRRKLPYVFTEQGIAIQVSIRIMETFVEMRKYMVNYRNRRK